MPVTWRSRATANSNCIPLPLRGDQRAPGPPIASAPAPLYGRLMATAHEVILLAGVLCLLAILAGQISSRIGTPLLLVFIGVGVLAGEDGPGGIRFDDFQTAYLV